jgi:peptide/nickel transport system substrate-binding protein
MLARIGVKVDLLAQPKQQYFAKVIKSGGYKTSFYLLGWTPPTLDPQNVIQDIMGCRDDPKDPARGEFNLGNYCNKEFDTVTDQVLQEADVAKRNLLIKQAFEIAIKDYAYIPLHQQSLASGVSKKLKVVQTPTNAVLPYWMVKQEE